MYKSFLKRILDFTAALLGLLVLSPLFVLVTIGLFFANQGKPFFFQLRPGKNGAIFKIVKFKTMNDNKGSNGALLADSERLTKIGLFVRKTSFDEIPQLINVIKGDMSLIGPRPLMVHYLELYSDLQNRRHELKPGITGWAQVNGRNTIDWDTKFELDVWYVDNISFLLDIKIILKTIYKVLHSEGINPENDIDSEPYNRKNSE